MSALGQKQTSAHVRSMSALPPIADIGTQPLNVRFVPKADSCTAAKLPGGLGSYVPIDEQAPLSSTTREAASRNSLALRSSPRPVSIPRRSHKPLHEPREERVLHVN